MLANGAKLGYKATTSGATYTDLAGLKEVPELGADPEKVDVTTLADTVKQYEMGIGDYGDLEFVFKYDNTSATSSYRVLREALKDNAKVSFQYTLKDGTAFTFDAQGCVKLGGGGVNAAIDFTLSLALGSEITVTDPS